MSETISEALEQSADRVINKFRINLSESDLRNWASDAVKVLRALRTSAAGAVKVKPLGWRKLSLPVSAEAARTAFGDYRIGPRDDGRGWYALLEGHSHLGPFASDYGARNAAQADFTARILSTLTTRDVTEQVTDEMVHAMMFKADHLDLPLGDTDARELLTAALNPKPSEVDGITPS